MPFEHSAFFCRSRNCSLSILCMPYTFSRDQQQSARSNDPYSARPGGGGAARGDNNDSSSAATNQQSLARGPAAAAAAAIASAAAIAAPEAAYCELCDVRGIFYFGFREGGERERLERERKGGALVFSFPDLPLLNPATPTPPKPDLKPTGLLPRRGRVEPAPGRRGPPPRRGAAEARAGDRGSVGRREGRRGCGGVGQRGLVQWKRGRRRRRLQVFCCSHGEGKGRGWRAGCGWAAAAAADSAAAESGPEPAPGACRRRRRRRARGARRVGSSRAGH